MRIPTIAVLAAAFAAACAPGRETATIGLPAPAAVRSMYAAWPESSRMAAEHTTAAYGNPHGATETMLVWRNVGPWKRIVLSREPTPHLFPKPHEDVLEQVVSYRVPPDKFDELAEFDGSVMVERTKGEMSARCDKEAANILALNLAHEIVTGKRTVADARAKYGEQIKAMMEKRPAPYTERLMFEPQPNAPYPDQPIL